MSSRPRPSRLDLSTTSIAQGPQTARPSAALGSQQSAGLAIHDVGLACLSPGFQTNDPTMREQLQRSFDVRDQQRQIIEARQKGTKPSTSNDNEGPQDTTMFGAPVRAPATSKRKGPPPGLSIAAPAASQFANDRVVQSAPLHQTFTGLRPGEQPSSRYAQHGPSGLSQMSHVHHVPATQTSNRLPPIADVFANDRLDVQASYLTTHSPSHPGGVPPPVPSPGFRSSQHQNQPPGSRPREFESAEDAMQGLSGGRDDLLPKVVHYGGVQPPTPPSPMYQDTNHHQQRQHHHHRQHATAGADGPGPHSGYADAAPDRDPDLVSRTSSMNGRRRGREEYERDNGSPPSSSSAGFRSRQHHQQQQEESASHRQGVFAERGGGAEDWRSGLSGNEKREEFLRLCERAWDLFHS